MKSEKSEELVDKGKELLSQQDYRGAEEYFIEALRLDDDATISNNLALAVFFSGEPERALNILQQYIEENRANPFTYALASRICCSIGKVEMARSYLDEAVKSFDEGLSALHRSQSNKIPDFLKEYTLIIMQAAGDLKDHRLVYELYSRWQPYHISWENKYLAAVASLNTGRYKRAASLWSSLAHISRLFTDMQQVAFLMEKGSIPPFEMGYDLLDYENLEKIVEEYYSDKDMPYRLMQEGYYRMLMLSMLMAEDDMESISRAATVLVKYGGEWGEQLGWRILESPAYSKNIKMATASAMLEKGIINKDEPLEVYIDGEWQEVHIKENSIPFEQDEELDNNIKKALKLQEKGDLDNAIKLLEFSAPVDYIYPPLTLTLANFYIHKGSLDEAYKLMDMLVRNYPDSPVVLFNFAVLMIQMGWLDKAREYLEKIDPEEVNEEMQENIREVYEKINYIEEQVNFLDPDSLTGVYEENQRKEVEEKTLKRNAMLARGMKNMPAQWLQAACSIYKLEPKSRRQEREKQLEEFLKNKDNLKKIIKQLTRDERNILKYLLHQEGWDFLEEVSDEFGSMEGDGFFWNEMPPESPLGRLWMSCLVMVGSASFDGGRWAIVIIPSDLREYLEQILLLK